MTQDSKLQALEKEGIDYWYPAENLRGKSVLRIPMSIVTNDPWNLDPLPK